MPNKAHPKDMTGRFHEIVSDPLNLLIRRVADAGVVVGGLVLLHNGHGVPLRGGHSYYGQYSDILVINRGVHEPLEEFTFQEMLAQLPDRPVMLELGALWAHYSMWMLQARPKGKAYMVEADPAGLEAGKRNFDHNGYKGTFELGYVTAGQITVDDFMVRHGIDRLQVLHADIQGHELAMLEGATAAFRDRRVDYAFVSTHKDFRHKGVVRWLNDNGYRIDVNSNCNSHTTSFDGFVLAVRPDLPRFMPKGPILGREAITASSPAALAAYVARMAQGMHHLPDAPALPMPVSGAI